MSYPTKKQISLDIYNNNIVYFNAKQGDAGSRYVEITCTENGKKIVIDQESAQAYIKFKKPDGKYGLNYAEVLSNGCIYFELTQQMLAVSGRAQFDVLLFDSVGEFDFNEETGQIKVTDLCLLSTISFYVNVLSSTVDDTLIESSNEFSALTTAIAQSIATEKLIQENESERQENETDRQEKETQRQDAETIRQNNEADRIRIFSENEADRKQIFETNESNRQTTFETNESKRQGDFDDSQTARQEAFNTTEEIRQETFDNNETDRQSAFDSNEALRQSTFETNESNRQTTFNNSESERQSDYEANEVARSTEFNDLVVDINEAISNCENATANADEATQKCDSATNNAIDATEATVTATESANIATSNANEAAERANASASAADEATTRANTAAENCENIAAGTGIVFTTDIVNNLTTIETGKVLDATQGTELLAMITALQETIDNMPKVHTGTTDPDNSLGNNGDYYLKLLTEE